MEKLVPHEPLCLWGPEGGKLQPSGQILPKIYFCTACKFCHRSVAQSCPTLCSPMDCSAPASPSSAPSQSLCKFTSMKSGMLFDHLILCHPLLLLPSIFPIGSLFSSELALCIRWPKYWSFGFSISSSSEHSGLISFRTDRFDLPAVQGTLKSLLQHRNLKASVLRCSAFFLTPLSHPYILLEKP